MILVFQEALRQFARQLPQFLWGGALFTRFPEVVSEDITRCIGTANVQKMRYDNELQIMLIQQSGGGVGVRIECLQ